MFQIAVCQPNLGFGGPGSSVLSVCGDPLTATGFADLAIVDAPPLAPVWLAVSLTPNPTPLLAGTLLPTPPLFLLSLGVTNNAGDIGIGPFSGGNGPLSVFVQALVMDASVPLGIGFSNAVEIQELP